MICTFLLFWRIFPHIFTDLICWIVNFWAFWEIVVGILNCVSFPLDERTWKKVGMEKGATKYLSNNEIQNMENLSAFHSKVEGGMAITRL